MTESLVFLPWVRRGGSLALPPDDRSSHPPSHVSTTVGVSVNDVPGADVTVQLLGPGDVTGLAPQQIIRTDPAAGAQTFESNYLALIEFDDPGLPWLFTPATAAAGALRPWLCLVVVREQSGVQLQPPGRGPLPVLRIGAPARPEAELPDLADSWAWAHAQVAADPAAGPAAVAGALSGDPARNLSRLVCGRLLAEQTGYLACVVPAFEAGRRTGLGDDPGDADGPAWQLAENMGPVELPVYHSWRFATGPAGDFQSLALKIRGRPVGPGFGTRPIDLSTSGLALGGVEDVQAPLAGALLAADSPAPGWPDPAQPARFAEALRRLLNLPDAAPASAPLLAPPRYGAAYRTPATLDASAPQRWYEQLNTDPVARVAAALGTRIVQQQQETLVAAAWDQSVDLRPATRLVGLAGFGFALAESLHRRHVATLTAEDGLFVLAPLQARLLAAPATSGTESFGVQWTRGELPGAALGTAVRRVIRSRGPAVRTVTRGGTSPTRPDWVAVMLPKARIERSFQPRVGPLTVDDLGPLLPAPREVSWGQLTAAAVTDRPPRPGFTITPTPDPGAGPRPLPLPDVGPRPDVPPEVVRPGRVDRPLAPLDEGSTARRRPDDGGGPARLRDRRRPGDPGEDPRIPDPIEPDPIDPDPVDPVDPRPPRRDSAAAALFRQVAAQQLAAFLGPPPQPRPVAGGLTLDTLFTEALAVTAPARTFAAAAAALFTTPPPPASPDLPLPGLSFVPRFPTAMAAALAELGQHWLLPGLDGVPANTALALRTNGAFVEAFLAGLNSEFGRELLWREFPTPLDATFFDRFWDSAVAPEEPPDIPPLAEWGERSLGAPTLREERFVLLLRSELIRRFPDTVVTATRPDADPPVTLAPVFRGSLDPDVSYFGFTLDLDDAKKYTVSLAEQPGAPRFGFDVGEAPDGATHAPASEPNAARLAGRLRQLPARITIPVTVLLREPTP